MIQGKLYGIIPVYSSIGLVNKSTNKVEKLFISWAKAAKYLSNITQGNDDEVKKLSDKYDLESFTGIKRLYLILTIGHEK